MTSPSDTVALTTDDQCVYARVICRGDSIPGQQPCGNVDLTEEQYDTQMNRPDSLWYCPNCGSSAIFDDDHFEDLHCPDEPPEPDGECFRGGEAAAFEAERMAEARKLK